MKRVLVAAGLALLAAGCSGSSSPSSKHVAPPKDFGLTGIGATRAAWNDRHSEDPNPHQVPGCCYVPKIDTAEGKALDTWYIVMSDGGYVYSYSRRFPRGTSQDDATATVIQDDLPPDARLVKHKLIGSCNNFLYGSRTLKRLPGKAAAPYVLVTYFAPNLGDVFFSRNVASANVGFWPNQSLPPC